jgi:hypothetical protein
LGVTSLLLSWKTFATGLFVNTPPERNSVYDIFRNTIGKPQHKNNRFLEGLSNTAKQLKYVSTHPAVSVTLNDVAFTALGLLVWTFVRQLDVTDLLENSVLSFLAPHKGEKHVAFKDKLEETAEDATGEVVDHAPRKRGRPRKNSVNGTNHTNASSTGSLRRSTRRKARQDYESDAEETYEPTTQTSRDVKQIETDGAYSTEDVLAGGESTALALLLAFTGGLGQLGAGILGAEVTRSD